MRLTRRSFCVFVTTLFLLTPVVLSGCGETPQNSEGASPSAGSTSSASNDNAAPTKLVLGFSPAVEADKVAEDAKPLAAFISQEVGIPVETFTSTDYVGLVEAMASKKVDIGMVPPLAYVLAEDQGAAKVILKTGRADKNDKTKTVTTYKAMFVAQADSGIKKIEDAKGKRIAFVDPSSTSGYLFPSAYLKKQNIDPETFFSQTIFAGSHDKAAQAVYNGDVDVAAIYEDARNLLEKNGIKDVKQKVVIIGYTGEIPNDTVAVRPGLSPELTEKIKAALLKFSQTPDGKKLLEETFEIREFVDAKNEDYDVVRETAKFMDVQLDMFAKKDKFAPEKLPSSRNFSGSPSPAASASP